MVPLNVHACVFCSLNRLCECTLLSILCVQMEEDTPTNTVVEHGGAEVRLCTQDLEIEKIDELVKKEDHSEVSLTVKISTQKKGGGAILQKVGPALVWPWPDQPDWFLRPRYR